MKTTLFALVPLVLALALGAGSPQESYVCPPCGAECHFTTYPKAGNCGGCGMDLVPIATVPQIGVLLTTGTQLASSMLALSMFAGSNAGRAFSVADTTEPLRLGDTIEVRPQFAFGEAPKLDVLVVPDGFGAWDDPMVVEWVKVAAEKARQVIAVGGGSVLLAKAGFLAGEHVPARRFLVERGKDLAPGPVYEDKPGFVHAGKFWLARDTGAGSAATLAVIAELAGEEKARRTAEEFGQTWAGTAK